MRRLLILTFATLFAASSVMGLAQIVPYATTLWQGPSITISKAKSQPTIQIVRDRSCGDPDLRPFAEVIDLSPASQLAVHEFLTARPSSRWVDDALAAWEEDGRTFAAPLAADNTYRRAVDADARILAIMHEAALAGDRRGANEVGAAKLYCYLGTERDVCSALEWFERADRLGDRAANTSLGYMMVAGVGLPRDLERGIARLDYAGRNGNEDAAEIVKAFRKGKLDEQLRAPPPGPICPVDLLN